MYKFLIFSNLVFNLDLSQDLSQRLMFFKNAILILKK